MASLRSLHGQGVNGAKKVGVERLFTFQPADATSAWARCLLDEHAACIRNIFVVMGDPTAIVDYP